jgi:hypothetical protein
MAPVMRSAYCDDVGRVDILSVLHVQPLVSACCLGNDAARLRDGKLDRQRKKPVAPSTSHQTDGSVDDVKWQHYQINGNPDIDQIRIERVKL